MARRVAIFGLGLLGGSIGLALRAADSAVEVVGYGHRRETLDRALAIGAITEIAQTPAAATDGADLLILCTPVGAFEPLLREIQPALGPDAVMTDVGSTKRSVVALAESILGPAADRFVGSHPMAGSEKRGIDFARTDLFRGATCIVTPTARTGAKPQAAVEALWRSLGMSILKLSPEAHDRLICDISHLPHALAAALVSMQSDESLKLAGKGFLDTTRVAGGDGALWRDILIDNRDNVAGSIQRLRDQLDALHKLLDPSKKQELADWLNAAAAKRARLLEEKLKELEG